MKKLVAIVLFALIAFSCEKPAKTGFVNMENAVKEYQEMKDAQAKYDKMSKEFQSEIERKAQAFQIKVDLYNKNVASMRQAEKASKEEELYGLQQQIQQEQQIKGRQLQMESQGAIDSIIVKVKDHIKEYGLKNGYQYIYSQSESGGVLYGQEDVNLTQTIIDELNAAFKPSPAVEVVEEK